MPRDIAVFARLPEAMRRYIILIIRRFHESGYQLLRPLRLDMRLFRRSYGEGIFMSQGVRGAQISTMGRKRGREWLEYADGLQIRYQPTWWWDYMIKDQQANR